MFHNEVLIGTILQELLESLVEDNEAFKIVFGTFYPVISQVFQTFQSHLSLEREKLRNIIKASDISLITVLNYLFNNIFYIESYGFP